MDSWFSWILITDQNKRTVLYKIGSHSYTEVLVAQNPFCAFNVSGCFSVVAQILNLWSLSSWVVFGCGLISSSCTPHFIVMLGTTSNLEWTFKKNCSIIWQRRNANTLVGHHTFEKPKSLKKTLTDMGSLKKHQKCCPLFLPQERGEIPCRCSSCEFWRVFRLSLFLATISSHSPIVLPPTCQPRQISTKKSFQPKSLEKPFSREKRKFKLI